MSEAIGIGVIGLGVMGQQMLARVAMHPRLRARAAWDPAAATQGESRRLYPSLALAAGPDEVIRTPGLRCLYIASPPRTHLEHSHRALAAGLAVFCEKPLAVDVAASRDAVGRIAAGGSPAVVNFSQASSLGLAALAAALVDGSIGRPQGVEIAVGFETWPEDWQRGAGAWLSERAEGGFTREVLSHWMFVLQRILGPAVVEETRPDYPGDGRGAERAIRSRLRAGGLPVTIAGEVGIAPPGYAHLTLRGSAGAVEVYDWYGVRRRSGDGGWIEEGTVAGNRQEARVAQLDQLVALIEGRLHTLPSFAEALAVQETIEALLAPAPGA